MQKLNKYIHNIYTKYWEQGSQNHIKYIIINYNKMFNQIHFDLWDVLIDMAKDKQILTYGEVSDRINYPTNQLGSLLHPIQDFCENNKLPPLTILIVKSNNGKPGEGFNSRKYSNFKEEKDKVFSYDWNNEKLVN